MPGNNYTLFRLFFAPSLVKEGSFLVLLHALHGAVEHGAGGAREAPPIFRLSIDAVFEVSRVAAEKMRKRENFLRNLPAPVL